MQDSAQPFSHALILEDIPEANIWMMQLLADTFPDIHIDQAYNLQNARQQVEAQYYDIALIDLSLPDGKGLEIIDWFARHSPRTISIVVTIFDDDQNLVEAICHGAKGYLLKDMEPLVFQHHLRQLVLGIPAFSPSMTQKILQYIKNNEKSSRRKTTKLPPLPLTTREKQVFVYIARGLQAPDVALQLGLSSYTVSSYIKDIYRKLNISSRAEAALLAQRYGLIDK